MQFVGFKNREATQRRATRHENQKRKSETYRWQMKKDVKNRLKLGLRPPIT